MTRLFDTPCSVSRLGFEQVVFLVEEFMKFIRFMLIAGVLVFFALIGIGMLVGVSASHPRSSSTDASTERGTQPSTDQSAVAPFIIRAGGRSYMGSEASQVGVAV